MDDFQYIKNRLDMLVAAVIGDPSDESKPGLIIRVDRLERSNKSLKNIIYILSGGLVSIIVGLFLKYI